MALCFGGTAVTKNIGWSFADPVSFQRFRRRKIGENTLGEGMK